MAAANAFARDQRLAILASPLSELTGFALAVGCGDPGHGLTAEKCQGYCSPAPPGAGGQAAALSIRRIDATNASASARLPKFAIG